MKIKGKNKWLLLLVAIVAVIFLAKAAYTPANILGLPFLSNAFAVISPGQTAYTGDSFQYTFILTNKDTQALPKATYDTNADGIPDTNIKLYKAYRMTDPAGNIVTTGCSTPDGSCNYIEEITTPIAVNGTTTISVSFSISASTPSSYAGNPYGVSSMLFKVTQVWDRSTNAWTDTPTIIDDVTKTSSLGQKFDVKTQTPPPTPTANTIMGWFTNLFASIWSALKSLFGWV